MVWHQVLDAYVVREEDEEEDDDDDDDDEKDNFRFVKIVH